MHGEVNDNNVENNVNVNDAGQQKTNVEATAQTNENADKHDSGNNDVDVTTASKNGSQKTFTQDDVTRMMTREKQQGRNSAFNELGIDPNDSKTIDMVKAIMASQKQQEEPPVAPSAELVEAQNRATIAEAKAEAMMLGAQPNYVDDIVTLAAAKIQNSDETDFKTVVSQLKEKYPVWFGEKSDDDDKNNVGSRGTGSSLGANSGSNSDKAGDLSLGQRLAAAKKPHKPSKSFWSK